MRAGRRKRRGFRLFDHRLMNVLFDMASMRLKRSFNMFRKPDGAAAVHASARRRAAIPKSRMFPVAT